MHHTGRDVPIQVQVTIELTGRMLLGSEIGAALCTLDAMKPDVIGLNCATGPLEMYEALRCLSDQARTPISALPNAGLPSVVDGKMSYDLTPDALAEHLSVFVRELGVSIVGGCCGTTPEHLAKLAGVRAVRSLAICGGAVRAGGVVPRHRGAHERQRLEALPRRHACRRLGDHGHHGTRPGA